MNATAKKVSWKPWPFFARNEPLRQRGAATKMAAPPGAAAAGDPMKKDSAANGSNTLTAGAPPTSAGGQLQASPYKSAVQELDTLRKTFRAVSQQYAKRIDMEIIRLRERVAGVGEQQMATEDRKQSGRKGGTRRAGPANSHLYDLRDMTTLLRTLDVKPLAGRRKDLKKIESLVEELRLLIERWG